MPRERTFAVKLPRCKKCGRELQVGKRARGWCRGCLNGLYRLVEMGVYKMEYLEAMGIVDGKESVKAYVEKELNARVS